MLKDSKLISEISGKLTDEDFYIPAHQTTFNELVSVWESKTPIDLITFTEHMRNKKILDIVGGVAFITSLFTFVPCADNHAYYTDIVKSKAVQREIIATCQLAIHKAHEEQHDVKGLLAEAQLNLASIKYGEKAKRKTLHEHVLDKIDRMQSGEPDQDVILTKFKELDRISPLRAGDMPVISGKKKSGKSIFALSILENICISQERPGLYFSLEDRVPKVVDRIFAGVSRIPMHRHHVKNMSEIEIAASTKAAEKISKARLIIRDDVFDLTQIIGEAKKALVEFPDLAVIVVDYGQLVRVSVKKGDSREREVATVSRAFRLFSMETGVPIIVLSQENSAGNTRESTALEQDCTALLRIKESEGDPKKRIIEIPFQRNGPSGEFFPICFLGEIARAENPTRPHDLVIDKQT